MKKILVFTLMLVATIACKNTSNKRAFFDPEDILGYWSTIVYDDEDKYTNNYWWKYEPDISFEIREKSGLRIMKEFQVENFIISATSNSELFNTESEPSEVSMVSGGKLLFCLEGWAENKKQTTIVVILNTQIGEADISFCTDGQWTEWRTIYLIHDY